MMLRLAAIKQLIWPGRGLPTTSPLPAMMTHLEEILIRRTNKIKQI